MSRPATGSTAITNADSTACHDDVTDDSKTCHDDVADDSKTRTAIRRRRGDVGKRLGRGLDRSPEVLRMMRAQMNLMLSEQYSPTDVILVFGKGISRTTVERDIVNAKRVTAIVQRRDISW